MSMTAKAKKEFDNVPIPEGIHNAICYSLVDIGSQYSEKYDKYSDSFIITWELPDIRLEREIDGEKLNQPKVISKTLTKSLGSKSNLYKLLTSWRGKSFTPQELQGFEIKKILGAPCQIQILHNIVGENTYANIANVLPLSRGVILDKPENELFFYELPLNEQGKLMTTLDLPENMHDWLKDIINKSKEYIDTVEFNNLNAAVNNTPVSEQPPATELPESEFDDVPF